MTQVYVVIDEDENGENVSVFTKLEDAVKAAKKACSDYHADQDEEAIDNIAEFGGFYEYDEGKFIHIHHAQLDAQPIITHIS